MTLIIYLARILANQRTVFEVTGFALHPTCKNNPINYLQYLDSQYRTVKTFPKEWIIAKAVRTEY